MEVNHLMFAAAVMMAATAISIGIAKKLEFGSIVALLVVGIALGPHSPTPLLTAGAKEMEAIGEIGVTLLLFAIGLDVKPSRLWSIRRLVFRLGFAQYVLTTVAILAFFLTVSGRAPFHWQSALIAGLALAFSSAAVPFPILAERGDAGSPHGRAVTGIEILQSLMVVPVLALIPILASGSAQQHNSIALDKMRDVVLAIVAVYVLGRFALPWALKLAARDLGPGGFNVIVLAAVFFACWLMGTAGMSMALGAFMMGVALSTSVYAEQVKASVNPAKQLLLALFFIAIGMDIELKEVVKLKAELLLFLPMLLLIKFSILLALARLFRLGWRSAILTGLLSVPFDETAYVILANANANGLLDGRQYAIGLSMISFSFVVSPLLINLGYKLTARIGNRKMEAAAEAEVTEGSVIVAGYGYVGAAICSLLEQARIDYVGFELNQECLAEARKAEHKVRYGDIGDPRMMDAISIGHARLVIVAGSRYETSRRIIAGLRQFYPELAVMTAVQYLVQREELRALGATDVVALSSEGMLSFGRAVLDRLGLEHDRSEYIIDSLAANESAALHALPPIEATTE